jgi:hypothetical protein
MRTLHDNSARGKHPAPCEQCPNVSRCATFRLACFAFSRYVAGRKWKPAQRVPSRLLLSEGHLEDDEQVAA